MANVVTELPDQRGIPKHLVGIESVGKDRVLDETCTDEKTWAGTGDDGIAVDEAGSERCLVKYELWDGPSPALDTWDRTWSGSVRLTSGRIRSVDRWSGGESYGEESDLGRANGLRQVGIHREALGHEEFTSERGVAVNVPGRGA